MGGRSLCRKGNPQSSGPHVTHKNRLVSKEEWSHDPTGNVSGEAFVALVMISLHVFLQETRRNTLIKDSMREQSIPSLVESWFQILQTYQQSHPELTCQCLEVVGAYVSWIDLNLIANDRSEQARGEASYT